MILHPHLNVQVSGRPAMGAGVALASNAHLHAGINSRWDSDGTYPATPFEAPSAAVTARGFYGSTIAVAARTRRGHRELTKHTALRAAHLAAAVACAASIDRGPGFITGAGTAVTRFNPIDFDIFVATKYGFFEGQVDPLTDVLSAPRLIGGPSTTTEKGVEYVPETAEGVETVERAVAVTVYASVAEAVIARSPLLVAEDLIGFVDFLEFILGTGRFVPIGMEFHRLPAEGAADILFVGTPVDTEGFVIIYGHSFLSIHGLGRL
jgi:hypothetical protein